MESLHHVYFCGAKPPPRTPSPRAWARTPPAQPIWLEAEAEEFFTWMLARAGLGATAYRPTVLARRTGACLRALQVRTFPEARRVAEADPRRFEAALEAVLIGVTDFFRDSAMFDALAAAVIAPAAARGERLRVWSAACSEGHELYSVAMLLAEAGLLRGSDLLGTDGRALAIERAAAGVFAAGAVQPLPAGRRAFFTSAAGGGLRASDELRQALRWRVADVLQTAEAGPLDLILCRNLAIYLQPAAVEQLWSGLCGALRSGGHLFVGKADSVTPRPDLMRVMPGLYRKTGDHAN